MKKFSIVRVEKEKSWEIQDLLENEVYLKVIVNGERIAEFSCSGTNINELIIGYLYFHGYIDKLGDISSMDYDIEKETVQMQIRKEESEYMNGIVTQKKEYKTEEVFSLMQNFISSSDKFQKTGAVHSAGIANKNGILTTFDDLSRHNTIFMLLGYSMLKNILLSDKILLLTCRLTKSIMDLILKTQSRIIITKAAPTYLAVKTCKKNDIALAGFVRGDRMNIYHGKEIFL